MKQATLGCYHIRWVHGAFERNKGFVSRLNFDLIKQQPWLISSPSNQIVSSYLLPSHQFPLAVQHDSSTALISSARHLPALHLPIHHPRLPPCFYWQPPLLWHLRVSHRHWGWHGARLPCLWVEVPQLNWDLEGRPGIWDMGQEEERNIKRSGYCVVKYIVLIWTNELNKGLLECLMTTSYYIFSANREIKTVISYQWNCTMLHRMFWVKRECIMYLGFEWIIFINLHLGFVNNEQAINILGWHRDKIKCRSGGNGGHFHCILSPSLPLTLHLSSRFVI